MRKIITVERYNHAEPSTVAVGDVLPMLTELTAGRNAVVVTDPNLYGFYGHIIRKYPHIVIPTGEENKILDTVAFIGRELLRMGADRSSYLVGFGGGIVTDITGFAASTYMRGVGFGFVATSLLAQVDASVGGKSGVNLDGYKNIIGTFNQPDFVLCDTSLLETLPEREMRAGMVEAFKCGLIRDERLFEMFEKHDYGEIVADGELLGRIIVGAIEVKAAVVEADEREAGERKLLNLGHTFGHAIEKSTGEYIHGEAVAIGIAMAAKASVELDMLDEADYSRVLKVIEGLGLPLQAAGVDRHVLAAAARSDKKKQGGDMELILLESIGRGVVKKVPVEALDALI